MRNLSIALAFYEEKYKPELENYLLSEEQLYYTSTPLDALEKCLVEEDRHPVVILKDGMVAGFFVLHGWDGVKDYSENKGAILMRAYSIQHSYQGQGIGRESMEQLIPFVKEQFPAKKEVILAVNVKNTRAQYVYHKAGFDDNGRRVMGPKGELIIFSREL
ncbi:GNAT family N-acetyltransferase [Niallia sp. RD1]|uniref:GNAT family N-acetyltransferase n=1 Tax=Niallia sp. RD1 TaxID=2962858 RepID=UPI0020C1A5F8|nr:GNAT family N-acetyltransferase [Niallia sp. RD1]MDU1848130.1 GNAT family N-acetyltransferase [Niallia nealsonii]UTI43559.1 GNAT family N-acetyltransferase [Niallia sp. RD1]